MALELAPDVRVNCVCPGYVDTDIGIMGTVYYRNYGDSILNYSPDKTSTNAIIKYTVPIIPRARYARFDFPISPALSPLGRGFYSGVSAGTPPREAALSRQYASRIVNGKVRPSPSAGKKFMSAIGP